MLAVFVAVAAACTTDGSGSPPAAVGEERVKAELVIATAVDASRVDPPFAANVGLGGSNASIFEPLVALAPDFTIQPALATAWEFHPPNTWRFQLRRDVKFHNGTPFDASAVTHMVQQIWAKTPAHPLSLGPDSVRVIDPATVELTPTRPNRRLVEQLAHPVNGIRAPNTFARDGSSPQDTPTGTGPFRFSSYRPNDTVQVERFDDYWGPKPKTQKITFRVIPDANTRHLALENGEVDAIYDLPREEVARLTGNRNVTVVKSPVGAYDALLLNHLRPTADGLKDLRVRQAVAAALDRSTIVRTVWMGNAEVMSTVIPASVLGSHASVVKGHGFDLARAGRLLDEAGWAPAQGGIRAKAGNPLKLRLVAMAKVHGQAPELIQAQLKLVGIDLEIVATEPSEYFAKLGQADGDVFMEIGNQHDANPIFLGGLFTAAPGFATHALSFGAGTQYDEVYSRAMASADTEEVRRLAADAMRIAVDDVVAAVPIAGIYRIWGLRSNVRGFTPHPSDFNQLWRDVYVAL